MAKGSKITDPRFANFETDPRFRLPSKRKAKTKLDKRFSRLLKDDEFTSASKVDRYGRKIKTDSKKKALQRLYQEEDEEEGEEEEEKEKQKGKKSDVEAEDEQDTSEIDDDDDVRRELAAVDAKYDPARGGGFSSSESDSSSSDEEDSDEDGDDENGDAAVNTKASMQRLRDEEAQVEAGEVTNRIAVVNLDWDHVKSRDLMALFSSFLPANGGRIEKIAIYPSEFGKERMQREELEGPPRELFRSSRKRDSDSDDEDEDGGSGSDSDDSSDPEADEKIKKSLIQEGSDKDFDSDALRAYQLDRLRYFYAVMTFSDKETAQKIYEATDGTEYQSSSNFIDLRFIPDDVTFDDEPRDECDRVPENYKPIEFITDALQHSKVKLTWDLHPEEAARKETIKRAFTGSRNDIEENDLRTYLASDSDDDDDDDMDEEEGENGAEGEDGKKLSKKELARRKMRAALGLGDEDSGPSSKQGPVGDMQITFTPALTEAAEKTEEEETTIEKYKRKERERKERKREAAKARREGRDPTEAVEQEESKGTGEKEKEEEEEEDLGFDDPFFTAEPTETKKTKTAMRKEERLARRAAREAEEAEKATQKAQLQLLMADDDQGGDGTGQLDHFDMNEITRAEKQAKKKKKFQKKGKHDDERGAGLQTGFKMDVDDDRFKAVFESHEYAIDPSNPKFKPTEGMRKLLEEGRKKRRADDGQEVVREAKKPKKEAKGREEGLSGLVASVKQKAAKQKKK